MLSEVEKERYSRHIKLAEFGIENQEKLKAAKVLVVGAGGLGCPVVQYLAAAGIGTIAIMDADEVSFSNLQRQTLYSPKQVGVLKVNAAKQWVNNFNPEVNCITIPENITVDNAMQIVANYDVVVDGTDNFATRYLINDVCQIVQKPLVFGSIFKFEGQVTVFHYQNGPSYRCLYPEPPAFGSVPACGEIGVLGVLPGIVGSYMALEAIKVICALGNVLVGQLLTIDTLSHQTNVIGFEKSDTVISELLDDYQQFCGVPTLQNEISVMELAELMRLKKVQLVDVREKHELEICSIGGRHIPLNSIPGNWQNLNLDSPVYLLCHHGMRSAMAQQWLNENTPLKTVNIVGGIHAWSIEVDSTIPRY